jgi:hypothetical protein
MADAFDRRGWTAHLRDQRPEGLTSGLRILLERMNT